MSRRTFASASKMKKPISPGANRSLTVAMILSSKDEPWVREGPARVDGEEGLLFPGIADAESSGDGRCAEERSDFKNSAIAHFRHVIDEDEDILREHSIIRRLHDLLMKRLV